MATLDSVIQLQRQGLSDNQIYTELVKQGISPKEILDSINQANVKGAISAPQEEASQMQASITETDPRGPVSQETDIAAASVSADEQAARAKMSMNQTPPQEMQGQVDYNQQYPPQNSEYQAAQGMPSDQYGQEYVGQEYYPQTPQGYTGQEYYSQPDSYNQETIMEITEQVVTEKTKEFQKSASELKTFKSLALEKMDDFELRLKRIEGIIDELQKSIIGKVGEFSKTTSLIHKDLDNLHGTVSKLMNPLIDNYNELKKITDKK